MFGWYKKLKHKLWYSYMDKVVNNESNLPPLEPVADDHIVVVEVDNKIEEVLLAGPVNNVPQVELTEVVPEEVVPEVEAPVTPKKKPGRPKGTTTATKATNKKLPPKA